MRLNTPNGNWTDLFPGEKSDELDVTPFEYFKSSGWFKKEENDFQLETQKEK